MIIKFGTDFVPMVFLTEDTVQNSDAKESEETTQATGSLLAKPAFIGGVSVGVLIAGGVLGFLLAKMKIKKGIELDEDI
ncbi:MAG TPA: hypothetical protein DCW90_10465 [Lachnospiraceae bacterium]|nr:hypothetical protein [uncultured Lachnoclostridium sp.]HAU85898.1 hypothetical protein [Lachnospiraceae bacterium]